MLGNMCSKMVLSSSTRIFLQGTHAKKEDPQTFSIGCIIHQLLLN